MLGAPKWMLGAPKWMLGAHLTQRKQHHVVHVTGLDRARVSGVSAPPHLRGAHQSEFSVSRAHQSEFS
eukprot:3099788-Pyramimonas_sp.AAC.1